MPKNGTFQSFLRFAAIAVPINEELILRAKWTATDELGV